MHVYQFGNCVNTACIVEVSALWVLQWGPGKDLERRCEAWQVFDDPDGSAAGNGKPAKRRQENLGAHSKHQDRNNLSYQAHCW